MKLPILLALLTLPAWAVVNIDWVTVGDAGNAADPATGLGAVGYQFNIGKYEVTNAQYSEFLNAVDPSGANPYSIYNSQMGFEPRGGISFQSGAAQGTKYSVRSNMADKPVVFVTWYDAARFTNWIQNGQGTGSSETGAYALNGATSGSFVRQNSATIWLPTTAEWYKAAFYDPTPGAGGGDQYWAFATQSNAIPGVAFSTNTGLISNPGSNIVNYQYGVDWNGADGNVSTVGSAGALSDSYYGTFDQSGNVAEWCDLGDGGTRVRGGAWGGDPYLVGIYSTFNYGNSYDSNFVGFRLASIPEPSAATLALLSATALMRRKR
jgi:formylglycine-generating enzyme required for sulfatase activity